jgi:CDP-diacylglycerol--glycerol-3-phosphate 3-phosphatidyltransferase
MLAMTNLPNLITLSRIFTIPLLIGIFYFPAEINIQGRNTFATVIFVVASLTDWFDGWLARKLNQTSSFGAFLDPVADKLMVCTVVIILIDLDRVNVIFGIIIVGREIAVSALREWMLQVGSKHRLKVNYLGKLKTVAQMVALPCLLFDSVIFNNFIDTREIGFWLFGLAVALTVISLLNYLIIALNDINNSA